ncbi:unnamed protein product [Lota lota]
MKLGLVFFTVLAAWTANVYSTHGPVPGCCLRVSNTRVPVHLIVDYRNQSTALCGIAAVVFTRKNAGRICADPNDAWTQRAVRKVNEDKAGGAGGASTESPRPKEGVRKVRKVRRECQRRRCCRKRKRMRVRPTERTAAA